MDVGSVDTLIAPLDDEGSDADRDEQEEDVGTDSGCDETAVLVEHEALGDDLAEPVDEGSGGG